MHHFFAVDKFPWLASVLHTFITGPLICLMLRASSSDMFSAEIRAAFTHIVEAAHAQDGDNQADGGSRHEQAVAKQVARELKASDEAKHAESLENLSDMSDNDNAARQAVIADQLRLGVAWENLGESKAHVRSEYNKSSWGRALLSAKPEISSFECSSSEH